MSPLCYLCILATRVLAISTPNKLTLRLVPFSDLDIDGSTTKCLSRLPHFTVGDTYPEGQTSEAEMCGPPQRALYRPDKQDMERCVFGKHGSHVQFSHSI